MLELDLVSDLHIDQWDSSLQNLYPCGEIKTFPFNWDKVNHSKILVVAGDISDNIDLRFNIPLLKDLFILLRLSQH